MNAHFKKIHRSGKAADGRSIRTESLAHARGMDRLATASRSRAGPEPRGEHHERPRPPPARARVRVSVRLDPGRPDAGPTGAAFVSPRLLPEPSLQRSQPSRDEPGGEPGSMASGVSGVGDARHDSGPAVAPATRGLTGGRRGRASAEAVKTPKTLEGPRRVSRALEDVLK